MAHPDWLGRQPEGPYWSSDGRSVYFLRKREGLRDPRSLPDRPRNPADEPGHRRRPGRGATPGSNWDRERNHRAFVRAGDIFLRDLGANGGLPQITRTAAAESAPFFTVDGDVALRRHLVRTRPGYGSCVVVAQARKRRKEVSRERRATDAICTAPPHYLGEDVEVMGSWLSPALHHLGVRQKGIQPLPSREAGPKPPPRATPGGGATAADRLPSRSCRARTRAPSRTFPVRTESSHGVLHPPSSDHHPNNASRCER